ncbi:MAG: hypothetical protein ABSC51_03270 [Gaiellaceae bacterium]
MKPSFLLDAAFIIIVWLSAQLIFHASLIIIIIVIFGAYALVFLYENWFHGRAKRERSELRRSRRSSAARFGWADQHEQPLPASSAGVGETRSAESEAVLPPEVIAAAAARAREQAERERVEEERSELEAKEQVAAERAAESAPEPEDAPEPGPRQKRRSLMADIAAAPGETLRTHPVGGWNVWQLERMMTARPEHDEKRDYERSLMLVYMREFADSDGQLPPEFDELVFETFGDLVRGPAFS